MTSGGTASNVTSAGGSIDSSAGSAGMLMTFLASHEPDDERDQT